MQNAEQCSSVPCPTGLSYVKIGVIPIAIARRHGLQIAPEREYVYCTYAFGGCVILPIFRIPDSTSMHMQHTAVRWKTGIRIDACAAFEYTVQRARNRRDDGGQLLVRRQLDGFVAYFGGD
jgi:hypothetical protein